MRNRVKYVKGQKIGDLIFVEEFCDGSTKYRKARFVCQYCNGVFVATIANVKTKNHTTSCGCVTGKLIGDKRSTHKKTRHPLYFVWHDMKDRCYNENYKLKHRYGDRGISVCDEWRHDFSSFYQWAISNGWENKLQIDRINNDGNYDPSNCRFVTSKVNNRNRPSTKMNEHKVAVLKRMIRRFSYKSDSELSSYFNISRVTVYDIRVGKTWSDIEI